MKHLLLALFSVITLLLTTPSATHSTLEQLSEIELSDVTGTAGITAKLRCGGPEKRWIPEANGTGVAWLDYDTDGWVDLLIVNGSSMEALRKLVINGTVLGRQDGLFLYRNLGDGRFQDVTARSGLTNPYWGTGANAADYNNDGCVDILVTTIGVDLLFKNRCDGTFAEVSSTAGLDRKVAWHTGSSFGDYDADGDLDLYVAGYVDVTTLPLNGDAPVCQYRGLSVFCGPQGLKGEADILYRNNGDGTFSNATQQAGVVDSAGYYGFSAVFDDFDGNGLIDLFVANDSCANYLYLNTGQGKFHEAALSHGIAFNSDGRPQANMGIAVGDYDNDGDLDLLTTTFSEDYYPLFEQQKPGFFEDVSARIGLGTSTMRSLGWGCGFADFDNDGDRDLWTANGHVYPNADTLGSTSYLQELSLFQNRENRFQLFSRGLTSAGKGSYRGGASADFNNDGRVDLVVLPIEGAPLLLENHTKSTNSWIGFALIGTQSNRDAVGARVEIEACGKRQIDTVRNGGGYLSRNDPRIHFGLDDCKLVEKAVIVWPQGKTQLLEHLIASQYVRIREATSQPSARLDPGSAALVSAPGGQH